MTVVDSRDLTTARTLGGLGVPSARHGMAISPDTRTLYLVATVDAGEPRLQVVDLAPEVTSIEPRALGLGGGGEVVVRGRGLEAATGNRDLQLISATALEARFTVAPECCQGPRLSTFAIRTRDGVPSRPLVTLRFARLGPYTDGYALADGLYEDVLERPARGAERRQVDDAIVADGEGGGPYARLTRDPTVRGARPMIQLLYDAALGRHPDRDGLEFWADALARGRTLSWVARVMARSPEFRERYRGATSLPRRPGVRERARPPARTRGSRPDWEAELRRGVSPARFVLLVALSAEHASRRATDIDVVLLFIGMLDRSPTTTELFREGRRLGAGETLADVAEDALGGQRVPGAAHRRLRSGSGGHRDQAVMRAPGVVPVKRRNSRVRWAWSA